MRHPAAQRAFAGILSGVLALSVPGRANAQSVEKVLLADSVYLFRVSGEAFAHGNSVVVINADDVLVFDTTMRPASARMIIEEIRKLTGKPVRYVVNSHWHPDHWGGNRAYAEAYPGAQIIATELTRLRMRRVAPSWPVTMAAVARKRRAALEEAIRTGQSPDGTPFTAEQRRNQEAAAEARDRTIGEIASGRLMPSIGYGDSLTIVSGSRMIRLFTRAGDAEASTVLHLPAEKIVATGDLLVHPVQWGSNSYHLTPWLANLREIDALDATTIVPGHGPAFSDERYLHAVIGLFDAALSRVHAALEAGAVTLEEVRDAVKLDDVKGEFTRGAPTLERRFADNSAALVEMAYREARDIIANGER